MEQKSFFKGALILSIAGIISKFLGAVYRIPLARLVGDEGMGLYQMAYPFYTLILAVSTAGIPLAISKLVAERSNRKDGAGIQKVFKLSMGLLLAVGLLGAIGLYTTAQYIAENILNEPRAALCLKAIAPAILFTSAMATFRGYFQGFQSMTPTALSQITEQLIRVTTVFIAAYYLLPFGVEYAAAGATFGAATGGLAALILLGGIYFWKKRKRPFMDWSKTPNNTEESNRDLIKQILSLAVPISIGGLVLPLMQTMDAFLVPGRLQAAGFSTAEATGLYGQLSGMAGAIINLPFIITTALAASLVPAIAHSIASGKADAVKGQFSTAMLLALIIVLPASVGLLVLAEPICVLLYDEPAAGIALAWLAPTVLAVGLFQTSTGALQGMGRAVAPVISLLWAVIIKGILTYTLTVIPSLGIRGAAIGTVVGFLAASFRNIFVISKIINFDWFRFKDHFLKPVVSVIAMGLVVILSFKGMIALGIKEELTTLAVITVGAGIYFLVLILIGGIKAGDIRRIPKIGPPLAGFLERLHLARD
ncbi:MAG: polysaccharide biosynthesis protein [Clostridia bacterium]|nr:polysaccharide biosynthesis protein [Clostridia bacterium]